MPLSSCKETIIYVTPDDIPNDDIKTPIELSVGIMGEDKPQTRAITVLPSEQNKYRAFKNSTSLYMIMKCDDVRTTNTRNPKYTRTFGLAGKVDNPADGSFSAIDFTRESGKFIRYWDDAYSRESALSIYAICLPGCNGYGENGIYDSRTVSLGGGTNFQNVAWTTDAMTTILPDWTIKNLNETNGLALNDICYSNNISNYTIGGTTTDNRIKFIESSKQFDRTKKMVFYHATAKFTFVINKGNGFAANDAFAFETGTNIKLTGFNNKVSGFDIATGDFTPSGGYSVGDIAKLWEDNTTDKVANSAYTLRGLVFPGTDMTIDDNSTSASEEEREKAKNAVTFTINGNKYIVSRKQLYDAILNKKDDSNNYVYGDGSNVSEDYLTGKTQLKAGVHYIFTFNISKTKIDNITATLVDWNEVSAEADPSNANKLSIIMETSAGDKDPAASYLYLSATTDANKSEVSASMKGYSNSSNRYDLEATKNKQAIAHYWPDNLTYYNLRTISPKVSLNQDGNDNDNYLTLTSGAVNNTSSGNNDYIWGAPLKEKHSATPHTVTYDMSKGYADYLYPAIGATKDNIHITQFHMMSDIEINLSTTAEGQPDRVNLTNATVSLTSFANNAQLMIGNGLVTKWDNITESQIITSETDESKYSWRVVPQELKRTGTNEGSVGILITTADNNVYKITDLSTLPVKIGTQTNQTIPTWKPGTKYIYNLKLTKTKIDNITATIVDWNTIEATYDNVQIQ